jgi:hypothetical protein
VATLPLSAAADMAIGPQVFQIQCKATVNGKAVTHLASVRTTVSQNLGNLPLPPRTLTTPVGLAVTEKPPFTLAAKFDAASATPGKPIALTVTATRAPGFTAEVVLAAAGLPPNVTAALKNIPANQNEVKVQLNVAAAAKVGQFPILISGKAKHQGRDVTATAPPLPLVIKK